jgi:tetratricopeptide (TPR) repeat protein
MPPSPPPIIPPIPELQEGLVHHRAGQLRQAAECYQRALADAPGNPEALLLLGIVARQSKQLPTSLQLLRSALERAPQHPSIHLNLALTYQASEQVQPAELHCRRALELDASLGAAWCCLGTLQAEAGREQEALESWKRSAELLTTSNRTEIAAGNFLYSRARYGAAKSVFEAAVAKLPGDGGAHFRLGLTHAALKEREPARACFEKALQLLPVFPEALYQLGSLDYLDRNYASAAGRYCEALRLRPNYLQVWCNLGTTYHACGKFPAAAHCYRTFLKHAPRHPVVLGNLGNTLLSLQDVVAAEASFRRAIAIDAGRPNLYNGLGNALFRQGKDTEAESCYRRALELSPGYAIACANLGNALLRQGHVEDALGYFEQALTLDPASPGAHFNLALAYLSLGRYAEGWREHEWRWDFKELKLRRKLSPRPQWQGEPLQGRTLLLHAEQGLGDTLQFLRFVPQLIAQGAQILLEVQPRLVRLLRNLPGVERVVCPGEALPSFDYHCPLMSLPHVLGTTLENIPPANPGLCACAAEIADAWRKWPAEGLRVGLAWAGNPENKGDFRRSTSLETLLPLGRVPGVQWFSLQMGAAAEQAKPFAEEFPLIDASSASRDMAETAALLSTLDLVISVDTSLAHLAGALDKPVWLLLPHPADWRWLQARADSPWYPTAELFRQPEMGNWAEPVARMRARLVQLAAASTRQLAARVSR